MPKGFEKCVENGGKVRTISGPNEKFDLRKGQYVRVCFKDGKMFKGEKKNKSKTADAVEKNS